MKSHKTGHDMASHEEQCSAMLCSVTWVRAVVDSSGCDPCNPRHPLHGLSVLLSPVSRGLHAASAGDAEKERKRKEKEEEKKGE